MNTFKIIFVIIVIFVASPFSSSADDEPRNPSVEVVKVGNTFNIFLSTPKAGKAFLRLQNPDGTYLEGFAASFTKVGGRSHAAFTFPYFANEDVKAVVFYGNKPIHRIKLK